MVPQIMMFSAADYIGSAGASGKCESLQQTQHYWSENLRINTTNICFISMCSHYFLLYAHISIHIWLYIYIYMHMFVHIHVNIYLFISTYTCTCRGIHVYIYISYTCIHLYAYYIDQPFTSFGSVNCCMRQRVPALFCFDWLNPKRAMPYAKLKVAGSMYAALVL
jgi:hypothetical protein